ncbi:phosphotransferase [Lysobacter pythonis]|uniref:Phosphotransferase n=1 Tax=Solilutibacter pythonis TaxID=2483112 RepID=A0A3M2I1W1_9GAMM|nr:phosphotransferase [Lysobacter pythonis]RMH93182.1 phosphotransferase [Lysobacter pythonis]
MNEPLDIDIATLIPHQGAMCLWRRVLGFDDRHVQVATDSHRDPAHPLRSDGQLRALHLCEYGAQAMAVHGGLLARGGGAARKGFLVALRGVTLHVSRIDTLPGELVCTAELLIDAENSQQYGFRIAHAGECLAEGRAAVMLQN